MEWRQGHALRERKAKYKRDEILESNNGKDQERESEMLTSDGGYTEPNQGK
jgi:hypothetical protein